MVKGVVAASTRARFYGKLRSDPEYLGRLDGEEPDISFGDWLDRGMGFAYHEGKSRWRAAYDAGAIQGFVYRTHATAGRALTGVLAPSQDSFGRAFPIVAVTTIALDAPSALASLPVGGETFAADAGAALRDARALASTTPVTSALPEIPLPNDAALEEALGDFGECIARSGLVAKLWKALFPRDRAEAAVRVIAALVTATRTLRSEPGGDARRYVRLPLGTGGSAAASFWLHLLDRIAGENTVPVATWSLTPDGALFAVLGKEPPVDFLLRLWTASFDDDQTIDAARLRSEAISDSSLPLGLARAARAPDSRIADLLECLATS
jgi:type VI secretion system ImpM family protein